ncbi:MAG: glycoside hydrolase family 97 protein [Saprospiraceae bacterium]
MVRFALFLLPFFTPFLLAAQPFLLSSPNGHLRLTVQTSPELSWQLQRDQQSLLLPTPISLTLDGHGGVLGKNMVVQKTEHNSIDRVLRPAVHQKNALVPERYNELVITCQGDWGVTFRLFDEGLAYRFFTKMSGEVTVLDEQVACRPASCRTVFFPEEETFYSHNERIFKPLNPKELTRNRLASLPVLLEQEDSTKILLTETDLQNYPGLWVHGGSGSPGTLQDTFPHFPKHTLETGDRDLTVTDREPFLARSAGNRTYPWRLFLIARKDMDLLTNQMPWLLAETSRIKDQDADWIRPGKVAWDWWNNLNVFGPDVTFRAGVNTATYRYFVDFAAENGLEYIVLDEGWSDPGNLLKINPDLNLDELAAYARSKKVGLILWTTWTSIDKQFEALLPQMKKWDIRGLKIDFMQRDDQPAVEFYWRMAEKGAANHLLLDFHGAHKPAGLYRTWPNVLTFEGVFGLENSKWDKDKRIGPEHNVTLPFTRQVAGPMDYTPGAMLNYQKDDWSPSWNRPASMGTRCHELAKYVVFESPLQMLADSPTNYKKEPECLRFLASVPAVWEKTVALDGRVGDYVALARLAQNGLWYIGAMTDWTARNLSLNTAFLPAGEYEMEVYTDGPNADRCAQDYQRTVQRLKSGQPIQAKLAAGGGYVAVLRKL